MTKKTFILHAVDRVCCVVGGGETQKIVSLNGPWRFAYTNRLSRAEVVKRFTVAVMIQPNPQLPTDDQFALDMQVPGYWV